MLKLINEKNKKTVIYVLGVLFLLGALFLVYRYFTSNKDLINRIPKDSVSVVKLDVKSLFEKAEFSRWKELEMFSEENLANLDKELKVIGKIYQDPEKSGVDFGNCVYAFFGNRSDAASGLVLSVDDCRNLESTVRSLDSSIEIQKKNDVYSAVFEENELVLIWDEEVALFYARRCADVKGSAMEVFEQDEEMSLLDDDTFMSFDSESCDAGVYMNVNAMNNRSNNGYEIEKVQGAAILFEFEKDQILAESRLYAKEGVDEDELLFLNEEKLSENISKFYAQRKTMGFVAMNFDMLKLFGVFNDDILENRNVSNSELLDALNGETYVNVIDYRKVPKTKQVRQLEYRSVRKAVPYNNYYNYYNNGYNYNYYYGNRSSYYYTTEPIWVTKTITVYEPELIYKVCLGVKSEEKARVIISKLDREVDDELRFSVENGYIVITNDSPSLGDPQPFADSGSVDVINDNVACGFFDLELEHYPTIQNEFKNEIDSRLNFLQLLKNVKFTAEGNEMHFELNFSNSDDHILWRFMKALDENWYGESGT